MDLLHHAFHISSVSPLKCNLRHASFCIFMKSSWSIIFRAKSGRLSWIAAPEMDPEGPSAIHQLKKCCSISENIIVYVYIYTYIYMIVYQQYPLVMTNGLPWKITMLLIGKPSISIRAIYTMAMLNNQMVYLIVDQQYQTENHISNISEIPIYCNCNMLQLHLSTEVHLKDSPPGRGMARRSRHCMGPPLNNAKKIRKAT